MPQGLLYPIPEGMFFEEAALVEPLSNAVHFVSDIPRWSPGTSSWSWV